MKKIFICLLFLWLMGFIAFSINIAQQSSAKLAAADAVVILTGGSGRVLEGLNILSQKMAKKMLITGVAKKTNITEILLLIKGISNDHREILKQNITLGHNATNTAGNALEAATWMQKNNFKSLILVTSNYHMPRSLLEFKALMPQIAIAVSPVEHYNFNILEWWKLLDHTKLIFIEYNKYLAAVVIFYQKRV